MAGEGAKLREAREALNMSLDDVEQITKIRPYYLRAIEEENYEVLPGTTYTRGFIRSFARCVNLDGNVLIEMYNETHLREEEEAPPPSPPMKPLARTSVWFRPPVIVVMAVVAIVVVLGGVYATNWGQSPKVSEYVPLPLPTQPEPEETTDPDTANTDEGSTNMTEVDDLNNPLDDFNDDSTLATASGLQASITFKERCWLIVRVDGEVVIDGTVESGEVRSVEAEQAIEFVSVGNAGGIDVTLNGKQIPPLGRSGEVVKNYTLTLESLESLS